MNVVFCGFEKDKLKEKAPKELIDEIRTLKCYSPNTTRNQMNILKANIETFEKIEQEYSSLDKFITHSTSSEVIKLLADSNSTTN